MSKYRICLVCIISVTTVSIFEEVRRIGEQIL